MDLLLDSSRFEVVGFAEIDKYASSVLRHHYPEVKNYGAIDSEGFTENLPDFDVLTGGTPCQSFSVARGAEANGLQGKSGLFYSYVQILKKCKPKYFLWENVKNVVSVNRGVDFLIIQTLLAEAGYDIRWEILSGSQFGIPQARERLFIIGTLREECGGEVLHQKQSSTGNGEEGARSSEGGQENQELIAYSKSTRASHIDYRLRTDGKANTLNTGEGCGNQSTQNYVVVFSKKRETLRHTDQAITIGAGEWRGINRNQETNVVISNHKIRRLTPVECERLMSWPDNWTKYGVDEKGRDIEISDNQRYRMCGNGVISVISKFILEEFLP